MEQAVQTCYDLSIRFTSIKILSIETWRACVLGEFSHYTVILDWKLLEAPVLEKRGFSGVVALLVPTSFTMK